MNEDIKKAIRTVQILHSGHLSIKNVHKGTFSLIIQCLRRQLNNGWISVDDRLPKNEERVLICADRKTFSGKVIQIRTTGMYEDGTMHTEDSGFSWEDNEFEYCEETDDYIIPEGWYEQNMYCEEFGIVDDFVTHWQPLPEPYKAD